MLTVPVFFGLEFDLMYASLATAKCQLSLATCFLAAFTTKCTLSLAFSNQNNVAAECKTAASSLGRAASVGARPNSLQRFAFVGFSTALHGASRL